MEFHGIGIYRVEDGKLDEEWFIDDSRAIFEQIGAIPVIPARRRSRSAPSRISAVVKILVCVKHVRLPHEEVELLEDASDLHPECLSSTLNEWDTFAVEEALRLKESTSGDAIVVTCGAPESEGSLRKCLAMGVSSGDPDRGSPAGSSRSLGPSRRWSWPNALTLCSVERNRVIGLKRRPDQRSPV